VEELDFFVFVALVTVVNAVIYYLSGVLQKQSFALKEDAEKAMAESRFYQDVIKDIFEENQDILERNRLVLHQIQTAREKDAPDPNKPSIKNFLAEQKELFLKMTYDDFVDWLESGTIQDLVEAQPYFESAGLKDHAEIMRVYLRDKGAL
jgi:hypothetical protein